MSDPPRRPAQGDSASPDRRALRVLLADDHRLLLEGLSNLLAAYGIEVAGLARDGAEAVKLAQSLRPDVILMDISMPECDGLCATRLIRAEWPEARIVVLTTSADDKDLFEAVKSGAYGFLLKSMGADELVEALGQVQEGIPPFSPGLAAKILTEFTKLAQGGGDTAGRGNDAATVRPGSATLPEAEACAERGEAQALTGRERQVLALVAQGLSYKEVGARLSLSPRTVKYHMAEIMERLHLNHRAQVLAYAGKMGLGGRD